MSLALTTFFSLQGEVTIIDHWYTFPLPAFLKRKVVGQTGALGICINFLSGHPSVPLSICLSSIEVECRKTDEWMKNHACVRAYDSFGDDTKKRFQETIALSFEFHFITCKSWPIALQQPRSLKVTCCHDCDNIFRLQSQNLRKEKKHIWLRFKVNRNKTSRLLYNKAKIVIGRLATLPSRLRPDGSCYETVTKIPLLIVYTGSYRGSLELYRDTWRLFNPVFFMRGTGIRQSCWHQVGLS